MFPNFVDIFLLLSILLITIVLYFNYCYQYWLKLGVPFLQPKFPLGNTNVYIQRGFNVGTISKYYYDEFKKNNKKFGGIYLITEPNLIIIDPELVRDILIKDFHHFVDRGIYHNEEKDALAKNLFVIDGNKWKTMRIKLTPTFTSGKIKQMFTSVKQCSENMLEVLQSVDGRNIGIKDVLSRFTIDVIGTCVFGIDCNSYKEPNSQFRRIGLRIFEFKLLRALKAFVILNLPKLSLKLGLTTNSQEVIDFFTNLVRETVEYRKNNHVERNDFLQLLIDLQNNPDYRLTIDEMAAQAFLFFAAGFETSSSTMTFTLYELAKNPEIQERLRKEINVVLGKNGGEFTYDNLKDMKYLAQVLDEGLRMYPIVPTLNRRCTIDYTLRNTNITIKQGIQILISTLGFHYDPEYYPNPFKFDPDRFNDENRELIQQYTYLPFGDGPRNCIGLRFGLMQSRLGIAQIIRNFKITLSPHMKEFEIDPFDTFLLDTTHKIQLKLEKI